LLFVPLSGVHINSHSLTITHACPHTHFTVFSVNICATFSHEDEYLSTYVISKRKPLSKIYPAASESAYKNDYLEN